MSDFIPYTISHIHLDIQTSALPGSLSQHTGHYVVFWWRHIAIGDVYIDPDHSLDHKDYIALLIDSITPAVSYYSDTCEGLPNWRVLLEEGRTDEWVLFMDNIFSPHVLQNHPSSVPVSVIICTRNRPGHLNRCLTMLAQLGTTAREIIVVDNAPDDMQSHSVVAQFEHVIYITEPRKGLDIARNTGLKAASQPLVTFVDDDVTVHPHCIIRVWETFQDESVSAMTGLVIAHELETKAQVIFERYWSFNRGYQDILYDESFFEVSLPKGPPVWEIGAGANMAFRRDIFERVGLFDERLDVGAAGCSGDSEMWYRILAHGYTIKYNPRAIVYHQHRKEIRSLKQQIVLYMRGHSAAALLQHNLVHPANYKKHIYVDLPRYYMKAIKKGFPHYNDSFSTLFSEIRGMISGIIFYLKNRKVPAQSEHGSQRTFRP